MTKPDEIKNFKTEREETAEQAEISAQLKSMAESGAGSVRGHLPNEVSLEKEGNQELNDLIKGQAEALLQQYKNITRIEDFVGGHGEDFQKQVFDCIEECERLCRAAVGLGADNIIILDKSGRPYGYMFLAVLKMVKLEYAKLNNVPPEEVKLPEIKYVNPTNKRVQLNGGEGLTGEENQYLRKLVDENSINVVFDESSNSGEKGFGLVGADSIESQYKNQNTVYTPSETPNRLGFTTAGATSEVIAKVTKSKVYPFIGFSGRAGGNFVEIYKNHFGQNPLRPVADKYLFENADDFKYEEIKVDLVDQLKTLIDKNNISIQDTILESILALMKHDMPISFAHESVARGNVTELLASQLTEKNDIEKVWEIVDKYNGAGVINSRSKKSNQIWLSGVNKEPSAEKRDDFYGLAKTISAFAIRDIYKKSFVENSDKA